MILPPLVFPDAAIPNFAGGGVDAVAHDPPDAIVGPYHNSSDKGEV